MSTFGLLCLCLGLGLGAAVFLLIRYSDDGYGPMPWRELLGWVLLWLSGPSLLVCGVIALVVYPSRAVGRTTCRHFAEQTGYETKFRILNWADTGTCLAKTTGGHWVKNTQIIINAPEKP